MYANMNFLMKIKSNFLQVLLAVLLIAAPTTNVFSQQNKSETIYIKTSAVCGMCKSLIEENIAFEKGIKDISVNLDTKIATVTYKPEKTNPENIRKAISKLGYDADTVPANLAAYNKLPACCKKGNAKH